MTHNIYVATNQAFLMGARKLLESGEITLEQYASICRRKSEMEYIKPIKKEQIFKDEFWRDLDLDYIGG